MLTLIAYRFTIDSLVPKVSYMTRMDQFILTGSVLVFLTLIQTLITGRLFTPGTQACQVRAGARR